MAEVKHEVTYLSDVDGILTMPSTPTKGNLPVFGDKTDLGASVSDSGKSISDFVTQDNIDDAVKSASFDILAEISGAYAIKAYSADQWSANMNYPAGSFCQHDGVGYRCKEEHESGTEFDASKWEVVLTSDGKSAIDAMLFGYSKDGLVGMNEVAASFDSDAQYVAGQLVAKDGTLQVCTKSGRGGAGAEFDSGAAVEKAISARVSGLVHQSAIVAEFSKEESYIKGQVCSHDGKFYECTTDSDKIDFSLGNWVERKFTDLLPTKTSAFENDSGFAYAVDIPKAVSSLTNDLNYISSSEIVPKYDTLSRTYSKGDVCAHDDKIWVCTDDVKKGEDWSEDKWVRTTLWAVIPDTTAKWDAIEGMPDNIVYGGSIVPEYSDKSSYEAGSLCSYKGKFYKAASYVPTGAPFTSGEGGYWEEVVYNDLIRNVSDFVNDVGYATESQIAREFSVESPYSVGDLCYRNGTLYVCKFAVEKGHGWNDADWSQTTISDQIPKITDVTWDSIIDRPGDLVHGDAVVGDFDATRTYKVGDVCSKDGKFYLCIDQVNPGDAWNSSENGDWKEVSYDEIVSLKKVSAFENDARYVSSSQIAKEYDSKQKYEKGDVCTKDGDIYVCQSPVSSGAIWNDDNWSKKTVSELVGQTQTQADWDEKDASEYSYIKNKPDIPFKIVAVTDHVDNATTARFDLTDRAVNVIEATIDAEKSIVLAIPERNASQSGDSLAMELCVVFNVSVKVDPTDDPVSKVKVSFFGANVVDCYGSYVDVSIPVGTKVSFRLTECYGSGSRYMVISGYGDYAHNSIALIDKALDDILASYGEVGASELGMYLKDDNGAYHQVKLVTDPETGEVSIGVEQEGV